MRVLVTGHNGYIGSVLVPLFQEAGHDVHGLDSFFFEDCTFGPDDTRIPEIRKDIRDVTVEDLRGFDAIIHLANISNDPLGDLNPECTFDINHVASTNLARLAKEAGVPRFLFSSSCSLYGKAGDDFLDENAGFNPVTAYGRAKVLVEQDLAKLADDRFSPTSLRNATAYGVSPRLRGDLVVNNLVGFAYATGDVYIKSDGSPWRPLVHIEDISRAFLAILEAPRHLVHNEAFNVGRTEENYRVREVADIVKEVVPGSRVTYAEGAGPDLRCYRVNCDRIARVLPSFKPQWTVRRGVEELYEAYKRSGLTIEQLQGTKYLRIKTIKKLQDEQRLDHKLCWIQNGSAPKERIESLYVDTGRCRASDAADLIPVLDLGVMPLADGLVKEEDLAKPELRFPLNVVFSPTSTLLQIRESVDPEVLFCRDYPYYSSFSDQLLEHSRKNVEAIIQARKLDSSCLAVELASNDGYLLKNYVAHGIPVLGIDPAEGPAKTAAERGVKTINTFFTRELAEKLVADGVRADVIHANNVLAHVRDLNGFVAGIGQLLAEDGVAVIETPYVRDLIDHCEFDTIYHEHLCYYSVSSLRYLFGRHGLWVNDLQHLGIHGGSLRVFVGKKDEPSETVQRYLREERERGIDRIEYYRDFAARVEDIKRRLVHLLQTLKQQGKRIAAYGAAAKGSTLINYIGIDRSLVSFVVDRNVHKQGKYMPGQRLPIFPVSKLLEEQPDFVLILAWNFKEEIMRQQSEYANRGGKFIVPIPEPRVVELKAAAVH
jgi:nucleoside-diphosphate-sugar epimerase/SAM-dependent methyltransferase